MVVAVSGELFQSVRSRRALKQDTHCKGIRSHHRKFLCPATSDSRVVDLSPTRIRKVLREGLEHLELTFVDTREEVRRHKDYRRSKLWLSERPFKQMLRTRQEPRKITAKRSRNIVPWVERLDTHDTENTMRWSQRKAAILCCGYASASCS